MSNNTQLFIPKKIKVGYQKRGGTYTKKLAYVIYYDDKGVLRKQTSWDGWRDKQIAADDFDNVPTEGFVLNKKAGGYNTGYNHRQTYCRVFDPRGFEFEINIPNLLFILQESNSMKGKGLDGEFVYAWHGKDLTLIPANCDEYKKSMRFTQLQSGKVGVADLVPGCAYLTKKNEELIFLGKLNWFIMNYKDGKEVLNEEKNYIFVNPNYKSYEEPDYDEDEDYDDDNDYSDGSEFEYQRHIVLKAITSLAIRHTETPVSNYAELMEEFSKCKNASRPIGLEIKPKKINYKKDKWGNLNGTYCLQKTDGVYETFNVRAESDYRNEELKGYRLNKQNVVSFKEGSLAIARDYSSGREKLYKKEQLDAMDFKELFVKMESGSKIKIDEYQND